MIDIIQRNKGAKEQFNHKVHNYSVCFGVLSPHLHLKYVQSFVVFLWIVHVRLVVSRDKFLEQLRHSFVLW